MDNLHQIKSSIRKFYSKKKFFKIFGEEIYIYDYEGNNLIYYVYKKALKLKEDIIVYTDTTNQVPVLHINAESILDLGTYYGIYKYQGESEVKIGSIKREFFKSLLRDKWLIFDENQQEVGYIQEDSPLNAIIRRLILGFLMPQRFDLFYKGKLSGVLRQTFNPISIRFKSDFSMNEEFPIELGIACLVLLQLIESRQNDDIF